MLALIQMVGRQLYKEKLRFFLLLCFLYNFISGHQVCGSPLPHTSHVILCRNQLGVLQFNSVLALTAWNSIRFHRFKAQSPKMRFPGDSVGKESACNVGELGSILRSGRSPGEGNGSPFQYSCLENSMDRGAWCQKELDTTE